MEYNKEMEDIFDKDINNLADDLGVSKFNLTNGLVHSIRKLKKREEELTNYNIYQDFKERRNEFKEINYDDERFKKSVKYYIFWENLSKKDKNKYREKRKDYYIKTREYVYNEIVYRLNEENVFLDKDLFKALLNTISNIETGEYKKEQSIQRSSKKFGVSESDIEESMNIVGYVEF